MSKLSGGKVLTAAISLYVPESEHKMYAYVTYSDLCYKAAIGKTARQLRKDKGVGASASAVKLLSEDERKRLNNYQLTVAGMLRMGKEYEEIKAMVIKTEEKQ